MNKAEKWYFKKYITIHSSKAESDYLLLFNAIVSQKTYDEQALKEQFKDSGVSKRFSELKSYLYQKILKSLMLFKSERSVDFQIFSLVEQSKILFERNLPEASLKLLEKAEKKAEEQSDFLWQLKIRFLKNDIGVSNLEVNQMEEFLTSDLEMENQIWLHYKKDLRIAQLHTKQRLIKYQHIFDRSKSIEQLNFDQKDIALLSSWPKMNTRSQINCLTMLSDYYVGINQPLKAVDHINQALAICDLIALNSVENTKLYLVGIWRLCHVQYSLNYFSDTQKTIARMEQLLNNKNLDLREKQHIFGLAMFFTIFIYLKSGRPELGISYFEDRSTYFYKHHSKFFTSYTLSIITGIAHLQMLTQSWEKARKHLNWIKKHDQLKKYKHINAQIKLAELILHYELNNQKLLDSLIASTYRNLKSKESILQADRVLINFLKKVNRLQDKKKIQKIATKSLLKIEEALVNAEGNTQLTYYRYTIVPWLKEKSNQTAI